MTIRSPLSEHSFELPIGAVAPIIFAILLRFPFPKQTRLHLILDPEAFRISHRVFV
jgi:hypothetical protein